MNFEIVLLIIAIVILAISCFMAGFRFGSESAYKEIICVLEKRTKNFTLAMEGRINNETH